MRTIKFYELTEKEVRDTQYRPLDREVKELETEDDWNYKDVIENDAEYSCSLWHECRDLYIWRIEGMYDSRYIAEIKQA